MLRQPVALLASKKFDREKAATVVGGYGWATVEVLLIAVNVLAVATLVTKDDEKSREARQLLEAQGMLKTAHPLWGFVERISASALHLGFTLLLFANPWWVLLTLSAHSVTNMLAVRYGRTHLLQTEIGLALAGAAAVIGGVLALA